MPPPSPDNQAVSDFLQRWSPGGPWLLTAIQPDRKAIETRTFHPGDERALSDWLSLYNGNRNLYFSVNPPLKDLNKKAVREDIKSVDWLHVDIDPRAGEDIDEERERALALLTTRLPEGVPPPTCIVFSGGGYQAFWRLETPIPIHGDLVRAEDAKHYNLQLELLFNADNCHNIDRIMRLPGTVNIPDARKRKKGRVEVLAELKELTETSYPISVFTRAPTVQEQSPDGGFSAAPVVEIGGDIERIMELSELDEWSVPDRVKVIIAQGSHPDEGHKSGDNSRSSWLFDVCCNLARQEVPDKIIYAIITDPEWPISESVLEMRSNAHKYAVRQIEKAKEFAIDPALQQLNDRFAVIETIGGKCRIVEEVIDETLGRPRLTLQSFEDFRNRFMHERVKIGVSDKSEPIYMPKGKWWLLNSKRRQFRTIVFAPGQEIRESYNMWKGFGCESRPGDCDLFLSHIENNLCNQDPAHLAYLLGWIANMLQHPNRPGEVAVVLRGGRGTGKSFFAVELGKLLGRHFLHISNGSHLTGNFNSHLRDLVLLFADEAFYAGDKKHASILKTLITETTLTIERKGVDVESAPNYIHLVMASNETHVIPAGGDERRFFVLDVGTEHQQDTTYFGAIAKQMDNGGREALLHHLLTMDLSEFEVRSVPKTKALQEQKLLSLDIEHEWWYQKLLDGRLLISDDTWKVSIVADELVDDFVEYTRRFNVTRRGNQTTLGKFLEKMCPSLKKSQRWAMIELPTGDGFTHKVRRRRRFYDMPTLEEARARWEELHGSERWPPVIAEEQERLDVQASGGSPF